MREGGKTHLCSTIEFKIMFLYMNRKCNIISNMHKACNMQVETLHEHDER